MKAAFIHDHNFVYNIETDLHYDGSGGAFDGNLWKRYLSLFEELVVVGRKADALPNRLVISSEKGVRFNLISGAHGAKALLKNRSAIKKELESIIHGVDFVIIRVPSILGKWAASICKQQKKKYVVEVVGDAFDAYWHHGNLLGKVVAPIQSFFMRKLVRESPHVIYVTKDKLQKRYPCPNNTEAISNVRLLQVGVVKDVEHYYLTDRSKFVVGMIGTFHVRYKGHIEIIKALKYLKDKGCQDIEMQFVGSGDSAWVLEIAEQYGVKNMINVVGTLQAGENGIFPFLDNLDLYIHPSLTEGLPRVVIEAMSRGRVCLASDAGGTSELLPSQYIHKAGDWKKLADDIELVIKAQKQDRLDTALKNLHEAERYLETVLQERREKFIKEALK